MAKAEVEKKTGVFRFWSPTEAKKKKVTVALDADSFREYVNGFNKDYERYKIRQAKVTDYLDKTSYVQNTHSWEWLKRNIPYFDCPDDKVKEMYYFRWWLYRLHVKNVDGYFVVTEFPQQVGWADKNNVINCPAGHQIYEARWLDDAEYMKSYLRYYMRSKDSKPRQYKLWLIDAAQQLNLVHPDKSFVKDMLGDFKRHYDKFDADYKDSDCFDMFWGSDWSDGMEYQIGGCGIRPTINSYMYGDAKALAQLAKFVGNTELQKAYNDKAEQIKQKVQDKLWDKQAKFFKAFKNSKGRDLDRKIYAGKIKGWKHIQKANQLVDVRELIGYVPWYFNMPDHNKGYEEAWRAFIDSTNGFKGPNGLSTAEMSHPLVYRVKHPKESSEFKSNGYPKTDCIWDGPLWPFAETQALVALANLLNNYKQDIVGKEDYFHELKQYTSAQYQLYAKGSKPRPWVGQSACFRHKKDGVVTWIYKEPNYYNHSGYCDLIISGLIGLRPQNADKLVVNPLVPANKWAYFCLDGVKYKGRYITVLYDKDGSRYKRGKGLKVYVDGRLVASAASLGKITVDLKAPSK
ncbi:MAG: hypothetical protein K8S55_11450 [Phycisphaerae bacterium]|nr:hypothetical protein [Phycisphaerae bacterium]